MIKCPICDKFLFNTSKKPGERVFDCAGHYRYVESQTNHEGMMMTRSQEYRYEEKKTIGPGWLARLIRRIFGEYPDRD